MIRRYRHITQRPDTFRLNPEAQAAQGLVFAGLAPGGLVGGTHYHDSSLYGNHGTLTNMAPATDYVFVPSLGRWACDFDGDDEYVILSRNPPTALSQISVSAWINGPKAGGDANGRVIDWYPAPCLYRYSWTGMLGWYGNIGGTSRDDRISFAEVFDGTLKHISVTFDGTNLRTYVNGVLDRTRTDWTGALSAPTNTFCIAGRSTGTDRCLSVKVGDLLVHHRALSPAEIAQLADPSNTLLSGLILPPRRVVFPAAVAGGIPEGSANLSAVGDIAAAGYTEHSGSAALSAVASLAAVGYRESVGTAELVVVASVDAVGCAESAAAASLDAVASISAVGYATHSGATELAAIGGITAAGYAEAYASAELSAVASLTAVGESPSAISDGYAALTAEADLDAVGYAQHSGSATLSAIANMVAVGEAPSLIPEGSATLSAIADLTAVGYASHAGEAALDAVADMVAVGSVPGEEGGAGTGGKTADGLTWADVDGLEWAEVDGLVWAIYLSASIAASQYHVPLPAGAQFHLPAPETSQAHVPAPGASQYA